MSKKDVLLLLAAEIVAALDDNRDDDIGDIVDGFKHKHVLKQYYQEQFPLVFVENANFNDDEYKEYEDQLGEYDQTILDDITYLLKFLMDKPQLMFEDE